MSISYNFYLSIDFSTSVGYKEESVFVSLGSICVGKSSLASQLEGTFPCSFWMKTKPGSEACVLPIIHAEGVNQ